MIYVPILKTRKQEYIIAKDMVDCFNDNIIPMFEIITEKYETKYLIDDVTGKYKYRQQGNRKMRIKKTPTDDDIITLDNICDLLNNKRVFIDYFRFSRKKYGNNVDLSKAELSWDISNDYNLYKYKVKSITKYGNMIPVISVKNTFDIKKGELRDFIKELQYISKSIALRITEEWLEVYKDIISELLREQDFFLFDIEEQEPESKFMEIDEINDLEVKARIILINSPRKSSIRNGEYPENGTTDLINNSAKIIALENSLNGYGDYCGLKDTMPLTGGSNGTGAALALFYNITENIFYSFCNHDTSLGTTGYFDLISKIFEVQSYLDETNDCPGIKKVLELYNRHSSGNWNTWHYINAVRYIYLTAKYL